MPTKVNVKYFHHLGSLRSWRDSCAGERRRSSHIPLRAKPARNFASGEAARLDFSPILSRFRHSRSRLRYQNKSSRARNPASYAGYHLGENSSKRKTLKSSVGSGCQTCYTDGGLPTHVPSPLSE